MQWHRVLSTDLTESLVVGERRADGRVEVGAAEFSVVQGRRHGRSDEIDRGHQCDRLGHRSVDFEIVGLERERPLDLEVTGRTVEVSGVMLTGPGPVEPSLVQTGAVRVGVGDEMPLRTGCVEHIGVAEEVLTHRHDRRHADRFIRVRLADDQGANLPVTVGRGRQADQLDRVAVA